MVAGHLQEKKGYYYAVLSYRNADGRRKTKWLSTGLPVKGNKKRAEAFLMEQRQHFVIPAADAPVDPSEDELFADYLQRWLQIARTTIAVTTYLNHKSKKNRNEKRKYYSRDDHPAIISRDDFIATQRLIANSKYGHKGLLPSLHVITAGILRGFVEINPHWAGFTKEDYFNAVSELEEQSSEMPVTNIQDTGAWHPHTSSSAHR